MWNFLDKIRRKTDAEKKSFAFVTAIVLTTIIAIVWFVSVYAISTGEGENRAESLSPIDNIRSQFKVITD